MKGKGWFAFADLVRNAQRTYARDARDDRRDSEGSGGRRLSAAEAKRLRRCARNIRSAGRGSLKPGHLSIIRAHDRLEGGDGRVIMTKAVRAAIKPSDHR